MPPRLASTTHTLLVLALVLVSVPLHGISVASMSTSGGAKPLFTAGGVSGRRNLDQASNEALTGAGATDLSWSGQAGLARHLLSTACSDDTDCAFSPDGTFCTGGTCGCDGNEDCTGDFLRFKCGGSGVCVGCITDADCLEDFNPGKDNGMVCLPSGLCGCNVDLDCPYFPKCDVDHCVECINDNDCPFPARADAGSLCFSNSCGCSTDADCPNANFAYCPYPDIDRACRSCVVNDNCPDPTLPVCHPLNYCVQCYVDSDCAAYEQGNICADGLCGCHTDADCTSTYPACDGTLCYECVSNANCTTNPNGNSCTPENNTCIYIPECATDEDCFGNPGGDVCDEHYQCVSDNICRVNVIDAGSRPPCPSSLSELPYLLEAEFSLALATCRPRIIINEAALASSFTDNYFELDACQAELQVSVETSLGRRHLLQSVTTIFFKLKLYAATLPQATKLSDLLFDRGFAIFLSASLQIPLNTVLANLAVARPAIVLLASAASDPHFTTARGDKFDFHGAPGDTYCVLSDQRFHVNARMMGAKGGASSGVDTRTWIDQVGILHGLDRVLVEAASPAETAFTDAGGRIFVNGKELLGKFAAVKLPSGISVSRSKTRTQVTIPGITVVNVEVVRAAFWDEGKGPGANFINLNFKDMNGTNSMHGILGQSFVSQAMQVLEGDTADYATSGIFAADCHFSRYDNNGS